MGKQMSLKTKLIIVFSMLIVMLVSLLTISLGSYFYNFQHAQILHFFYSIVEQADSSYEGFSRSMEIRASDWASDAYIRETTEKLLNATGQPKEILAAELSDYFKSNKLLIDPSVMMLEVLDKDGVVVASSRRERIGENEKEEENRFNEAIQGNFGEVFIKNVVFEEDEDPKSPMNHVTTRIFSTSSTEEKPVPLQAVLLLHFVNTDQIKESIGGNFTEAKDVNKQGFLKHYNSADIYLVNSDRLMMVPSRFVKDAVLKQKVDTPPVRACLESRRDFIGEYTDYLGRTVLGAAECVNGGKNVLIFEVEKQEALSFMKDIYLRIAVGALVAIFLGVAAVVLFVHWFLKDLVTLTGMIKNIADKKDFSVRIKDVPSGEIGILSRSFNYLLDSLDAFKKNVLQSEAGLKASNISLQQKTSDLEKMNQLMVGRELKMIELKKEIDGLKGNEPENSK